MRSWGKGRAARPALQSVLQGPMRHGKVGLRETRREMDAFATGQGGVAGAIVFDLGDEEV